MRIYEIYSMACASIGELVNVGDKVYIGNSKYTIDKIERSISAFSVIEKEGLLDFIFIEKTENEEINKKIRAVKALLSLAR